MNYEEQLARIEQKLKSLGIDLSKAFTPPVSQQELAAFEQTYHIRLPEEYKLFITRIGNGGYGPYLEEGFTSLAQSVLASMKPSLPFPYARAQKVPYWDNQTAQELGELSRFFHHAANAHGKILLSEYGCGIYAFLIVKGEAYGQVWMDQRESDWGGLYPTSPEDDLTPAKNR